MVSDGLTDEQIAELESKQPASESSSQSGGLTDEQIAQLESKSADSPQSDQSPITSPMDLGVRAGEAFGKFSSKAAGGAREFIRSVGTGEDAANAYMRGYVNPEKSKRLQDGAIQGANDLMTKLGADKLPYSANFAVRAAAGLIPSAAGQLTDIATNPSDLLSIAAFERFPTLFKQAAPELAARISEFANKKRSVSEIADNLKNQASSVGKTIQNALSKPKLGSDFVAPNSADVNEMRMELATEAQDANTALLNKKSIEMANLDAKHTEIQNGLDTKIKILDGKIQPPAGEVNIPTVADSSTLKLRKKFPEYARDLSSRYGEAYQKAIAGESRPIEQVYNAVGQTIEEDGFLIKPESQWSDSQRAIYDYQQDLKGKIQKTAVQTDPMMNEQTQTGTPVLKLSDVDGQVKSILGAKAGQKYSQGDHILTIFREKMAGVAGEAAPKIKAVNIKFAPELQTKNELYKINQPFNLSGDKNTTAGINFFSKYARGEMTNPSQMRIIRDIQANPKLGADIIKPLDDMTLKRNTILRNKYELAKNAPIERQAIDQKYRDLKGALTQDVRGQAAVLRAMRENALADESMAKKIKLATAGAISTVTGGGYLWKKLIH